MEIFSCDFVEDKMSIGNSICPTEVIAVQNESRHLDDYLKSYS